MFCSWCGGLLNFLGRLGSASWFRCSGCGMEQQRSFLCVDFDHIDDEEF